MSVEVTTSSGISVTVTTPASSSVTVTNKGPKGDTGEAGARGATGATGPAGADGTAGTTFTAGTGLTLSGGNLNVDSSQSSIDHDSLNNFVAAEHVDWAGASAGTIHASNYTDTTTNTQLSQEQVEDFAGALVATGGTKTNIAVTYDDANGDMDFVVGGGKQSFTFHKRVTLTATDEWRAGAPDNYYMANELYGLSNAKTGDNYTATVASNWAAFVYRNFTVAHACTIDSFVCAGYQNNTDSDITVGIWKHSAQTTETNHSAADAVVDFIGEISFTAAADTSSMHASQTLTSFQSGTSLAAGEGIILAARRTGGGTDTTYWYIHGAIGVTYT